MQFKINYFSYGFLCLLIIGEAAFAQVILPDTSGRSPDLSVDPFESAGERNERKASQTKKAQQVEPEITLDQPESEITTIPLNELEPPQINQDIQTQPAQVIPTEPSVNIQVLENSPTTAPAPTKLGSDPPYSYTLFLDVDYIYKFSGGASSDPMSDNPDEVPESSVIVGLLHFYGEYDTAKANLWKNGTFALHVIYGEGDSPTGTVGDLRSVSNIDASFMSEEGMTMPGLDILELWYEHAFPFNKSSIRFGIGYLSSDFYKSKYTGLFLTSGINSIGTEVLWNTMASNPPNTTLGLWYKTKLMDNVYAQAVAFDGFPDHSTKVFDLKLDENEGVFLATEAGWLTGKAKQKDYFKLGVGYWYLSQNIKQNMMIGVPDYEGSPIATRGFYTVIDKAINDNIGSFFKGGIAVNGINKYRHYFTTGVTYKGILPSRPNDNAGIAVVQSKLSDTYIRLHGSDEQGEVITYTHETIFELTYSIPVKKWLMLQPDLQYVIQPGMSVKNENALVGILRAEITLL